MDSSKEAREMTADEWAAKLLSGPLDVNTLAIVLRTAEARGAQKERSACCDLAREHAHTIDERSIAETPYGAQMTEQQRIDVASSQRHVAQYVGSLIFNRNPKPPPGFALDR